VLTPQDLEAQADAVQGIVRQWIAPLPTALAGDLPHVSAPVRRVLANAGSPHWPTSCTVQNTNWPGYTAWGREHSGHSARR
ncbi:hypothetical protein, partial [Deinococcus sp.]|uniref:hypothetical protein n=1 Tax=Deinococcus sp. TaxID=47478 RepID=UPI002869E0C1